MHDSDQTSITVYNDANWKRLSNTVWGGEGGGDIQNALKFPYNAEYAFMLLCKYIIRAIILDNDLVRTIKVGIQRNVSGQHAPFCL
jgi:hypothetical protein